MKIMSCRRFRFGAYCSALAVCGSLLSVMVAPSFADDPDAPASGSWQFGDKEVDKDADGHDRVGKGAESGSSSSFDKGKFEVKSTSERKDGDKSTSAYISVVFNQKFKWVPNSSSQTPTPDRFFNVDITDFGILTATPYRDPMITDEKAKPGIAQAGGLAYLATNQNSTQMTVDKENKENNRVVDTTLGGTARTEISFGFSLEATTSASTLSETNLGGSGGDGEDVVLVSSGAEKYINKACKATARVWRVFSDILPGRPAVP